MFGIIGFQDLKVNCIIGINPEERLQEQEIFIDLQVESDFSKVSITDDLSEAINYVTLSEFCADFAITGKYNMIESLAHDLLQRLQYKFHLAWIKIIIKKPKALKNASFSFVELEHGRRIEV
jgi:7,8-dihydroneopterin aldolase/epimerase/oxygenase